MSFELIEIFDKFNGYKDYLCPYAHIYYKIYLRPLHEKQREFILGRGCRTA